MLNKVLSACVLCLFLAHFAGFYIYFFVQMNQVRHEMRAKLKALPPEKLDLLILSPSEFEKAKVEEHEVRFNGKMYDIAWIEERDGSILVYCLHDKAEDNLLAFIDKILKTPLKDKKVPPQIVKFTSLSFIVPSAFRCSESTLKSIKNPTHYQLYLFSFFPSLDSPPPRLRMLS